MKVIVDWDDCVTPLTEHITKTVNEEMGLSITAKEACTWSYFSTVPGVKDRYGDVYNNHHIVSTTPVNPGSILLLDMINRHHDLMIVTAASLEGAPGRGIVYDKYFPFLSRRQFIICADKSKVDADLRIDDNAGNLYSPEDVLFKKLWNYRDWINFNTLEGWFAIGRFLIAKGWLPDFESPWCTWHNKCKEDSWRGYTCLANLAEGRVFECPYKDPVDRLNRDYSCSDYKALAGV